MPPQPWKAPIEAGPSRSATRLRSLQQEGGDGGAREGGRGRIAGDLAEEAQEQGDAGQAGVEVVRRGLERPGLVAEFEADPGGVVPSRTAISANQPPTARA